MNNCLHWGTWWDCVFHGVKTAGYSCWHLNQLEMHSLLSSGKTHYTAGVVYLHEKHEDGQLVPWLNEIRADSVQFFWVFSAGHMMAASVTVIIYTCLRPEDMGWGVWFSPLVRDMKGFSGHLRSCDMTIPLCREGWQRQAYGTGVSVLESGVGLALCGHLTPSVFANKVKSHSWEYFKLCNPAL